MKIEIDKEELKSGTVKVLYAHGDRTIIEDIEIIKDDTGTALLDKILAIFYPDAINSRTKPSERERIYDELRQSLRQLIVLEHTEAEDKK